MSQEAWSLLIYTLVCCIGSLSCYLIYKDYFHPGIIITWIYYYATAGTVILYIFGFNIQLGIKTYYIADAIGISTLAVLSFIIPAFFIRKTVTGNKSLYIPESIKPQVYRILGMFSTVVTLVMIVSFSLVANTFISTGLAKSQILSLLPGWYLTAHYGFMLFWMVFFAVILSIGDFAFLKRNWLLNLNFLFYLCYCILTRERDFVLLLIPVLITISRMKKIGLVKMISYMFLGLLAIVGLFSLKSDELSLDVMEIYLNQGNSLLVLTNVMSWIDNGVNFEYGGTYINSLINLMPSSIYREGVPLIIWFKENYNSASSVGYGFSLEAEGFLNLGSVGVIISFLIIGAVFQICYLKFQKNKLVWNYLYLFLVPYFVYSIRGDSLMLFKGLAYGFLLFAILLFCSQGFKIHIRKNGSNYKE